MAPLLTLSLALAVACHYYAVTALSVFGAAELAWSVVSRRVRWSVWTGCILASSPFFLTLPVLLHLREEFGADFWSLPRWSNMLGTYGLYTGFSFTVNLVLLALLGLVILGVIYAKLSKPSQASREDGFSAAEMALVGGFLFYPVFLVTLTITVSRA